MTTRTSTRNAADLIAARQSFTTSGALRGEAPASSASTWDCGRLPGDHARQLAGDLLAGHVDYIVHSYETPIAWHRAGIGWTVPDVRYTATTSRHQGVVRQAVQ